MLATGLIKVKMDKAGWKAKTKTKLENKFDPLGENIAYFDRHDLEVRIRIEPLLWCVVLTADIDSMI